MLTRRSALSSLAAPLVWRSGAPAARRPNILFILMDDMGYRALSCYGNPYVETPHLDRLAGQGMRFTAAYVTPQCTPSRATFLTGQYTARNRMWHVIPWYGTPWARVREPEFLDNLPRGAFTLAKGLKQAGYATACIGKWHLTTNEDGDYNSLRPEGAPHYGFDAGMLPVPKEAMALDRGVDLLTDRAIRFIEDHRERPFFCYLAHHAIHRQLAAPPALVAKYRKKGYPDTGLNKAVLLASLEHMDAAIGRLLRRVDELGLREKTAVVFMTDNGGICESYNPKPVRDGQSGGWRIVPADPEFENTPLRAGKGFAQEGGIRVPMTVRWPGVVRPGSVCETPVHIVDMMPTFFQMAGARAPASHVMDGVDLTPLWSGGQAPAPRPLYFYMPLYDLRWANTPCAAVRDGDYKLIEYFGDYIDLEANNVYRIGRRLELYDLRRDIGETKNLAATMTERAARLSARLHEWIRSCGAAVPGENPRYDPARALEETKIRPAG